MQNGPYIAKRLLPGVVRSICERKNIDYQTFSDEWVLRLSRGTILRWIVGYKFDLNTSAAGQLAQDKVATYMALAAAHVPAVEHYLVRSVPHEHVQLEAIRQHIGTRSVVIKPLDGTGGRAVVRYGSVDEGMVAIGLSGEPAWAISPHYDLRAEYRLILLDGEMLLALEKTKPTFRGDLKLFNLGYGAVGIDIVDATLLENLRAMAKKVVKVLGLRLAAVDIVLTDNKELRVLEVNDGITLEHYANQSAEYRERAINVYTAVIEKMLYA